MRIARVVILSMCLFALAGAAVAQEHFTEGPVWVISFYRTRPGQFDNYMKYLRSNYLVTSTESKRQGLILDTKVFVKAPRSHDDWDVAVAYLYPSYGKALDYNAADDEKGKAIAAQHFKTMDQDQQQKMTAPRLEMRDFVGSDLVREVTLRPMTTPK
ncbi:MAG TPA: hypothetical protein VGS96_05665 [Thermoanaerobaculia bacterium]|jgi:hypothetical protein|nr:hypothetical protein [Thermoanaerobaculia bacterium]